MNDSYSELSIILSKWLLGVAVYGYEQAQHGGGKQYRWGDRVITQRTAVRLRLVNVGASSLARGTGQLGYMYDKQCGGIYMFEGLSVMVPPGSGGATTQWGSCPVF